MLRYHGTAVLLLFLSTIPTIPAYAVLDLVYGEAAACPVAA